MPSQPKKPKAPHPPKLDDTEKTRQAKPGFYIAKHCAITTRRGLLAEGESIEATDLAGGADALQTFVKHQKIIEVGE